MSVSKANDIEEEQGPTGQAMIPIWLLREPDLSDEAKLLYVVLSSWVTGDGWCNWQHGNAGCLEGVPIKEPVRELVRLGVLVTRPDPAEFMLSMYEGGLH